MNNNIHQSLKRKISTKGLLKPLSLLGIAVLISFLTQAGYAQAATKPGQRVSVPKCKGEIQSAFFNIPQAKWVSLNLKKEGLPSSAWIYSIEDPSFIKINPQFSRYPRKQYFLYGKKIGATNITLRSRNNVCTMVALSIGIDTAAVQEKLAELMPEEKNIKVVAAADSLVLTGSVANATSVDKAMSITKAYLRQSKASDKKGPSSSGVNNGDEGVLNMLGVAAPQQVMLEVKIAEVNKTLLHKLGMKFDWTTSKGSWTANLVSSLLFGTTTNPIGGLNLTKSNGNTLALDAELSDGLVKILAEPNIMAVSGQEGSFLAGGRIFIPVPNDDNGVTLEEKEFGVSLKFLPTVLADGRINLKVAPEVSDFVRIDSSGTSGLTGQDINIILPVITTRRVSTTVQLFDGQSFAIGGLIKSNISANIKALPGLGEIPILGALFRSNDFQEEKTELVIVITPHLVKPLKPDYTLPTENHITPSPKEIYLTGRLEGSAKKATPPVEKTEEPTSPSAPQQAEQPAPVAPSGPIGFE